MKSPYAWASRISSRSSWGLPWVSRCRRSAVVWSTLPPSAQRSSSLTSGRPSGGSSIRSARSSRHIALTGSGSTVPVRTVARTLAPSARAMSETSAAERGSVRCRSSTAITMRRPSASARSASRRPAGARPAPPWPAGSSGRTVARLPKGSVLVTVLGVADQTAYRCGSRVAVASLSRRVLPTPALPPMTTPRPVCPVAEPVRRASSSTRPTNRQDATHAAYIKL